MQAGDIALNSSYPKAKLYRDDIRLHREARVCDGASWTKKDIIYVVGSVLGSKIRRLWLVYGDCYAADKDIYEKTFKSISSKISEIDHLEFRQKSNELAGIRRVDPLGITYLRVRGMWGIESPRKVFGALVESRDDIETEVHAVMLEEKYATFSLGDRREVESNKLLTVRKIEVRSPNNPAKYLRAREISYFK